jgi:peptidoglycan hydrolase CwlO-like protein
MVGGSTQDLQERVAKLEAWLGAPTEESSSFTLAEQLAAAQKAIADLQISFDEHAAQTLQQLEERVEEQANLAAPMEGLSEGMESLQDEVKDLSARMETKQAVLKRAIGGMPINGEAPSKLKVPKPKPFVGAKSAKELENFLWDMEQYF